MYVCTNVRAYVHTCVDTCVRTHVCRHVCTYIRICVILHSQARHFCMHNVCWGISKYVHETLIKPSIVVWCFGTELNSEHSSIQTTFQYPHMSYSTPPFLNYFFVFVFISWALSCSVFSYIVFIFLWNIIFFLLLYLVFYPPLCDLLTPSFLSSLFLYCFPSPLPLFIPFLSQIKIIPLLSFMSLLSSIPTAIFVVCLLPKLKAATDTDCLLRAHLLCCHHGFVFRSS